MIVLSEGEMPGDRPKACQEAVEERHIVVHDVRRDVEAK
jgi:hypothetical protein